jgi:hypothetical protein
LAVGESLCVDVPYTIPGGAADPLINTVTATAEDLLAFIVSDTDFAQVDLVHPGFYVEKTCLTPQVPVGGNAEFEITIENTGDCNLVITTTEPEIAGPFVLLEGETSISTIYRDGPIQDCGGYDGIYNDVWAYWTLPPDEYPCVMTNKDSMWAEACCQIVDPCIGVSKEADCDISKVTDSVTYEICVWNCTDPPAALHNVSVVDDHFDLTGLFPTELAPEETVCVFYTYTFEEADDSGLPYPQAEFVNTVTANATNVAGFAAPEVTASETVYLVHPCLNVRKECNETAPVPMGEDAEFRIAITNCGDVDLMITTNEPEIPGEIRLAHGDSLVQLVYRTCDEIEEYNIINVVWTLPPEFCELDNTGEEWADATCPCEEVGLEGRWTGGGTITWDASDPPGAHVTHGFQFRCNMLPPNRLEVNWEGNRWHMMEILSVTCLMNPDLPPPDPPYAPINEVYATGEGRYNNQRGYIAEWYFTDVGEPGENDYAEIVITAPDGTVVLDAEGYLEFGNHQAHVHNLPGWMGDSTPEPIGEGDGLLPEHKEDGEQLPTETAVSPSSPNPFRDTARIQYQLPESGAVAIDVYDVAGRHVVSLLDEEMPAGYHEAVWNGTNNAGAQVPTGVYFYKVRLDEETLLRKVILVR